MAVANRVYSVATSRPGISASDATIRLWKTTTLLYHHKIYQTAIDFSKSLLYGTADPLIRSILTMNIGIMYARMEQHEQAERCFEEAAVFRPELCIARFLLGTTAYRRKQFKEAERAFKDCRRLFPKDCQSIDYGSLGLDYILRLDLVIMNEAYSTWECCQPQMANSMQHLPAHRLYTLDDKLLFHQPRSLFVELDGDLITENLRVPAETDLRSTGLPFKETKPPSALHSSKKSNGTLCRSKSMQMAKFLPSARSYSAIRYRSLDDLKHVTNPPPQHGCDNAINAATRQHAIEAARTQHLNVQEVADDKSRQFGSTRPHFDRRPINISEAPQKLGPGPVPVRNLHRICHRQQPPTGDDIVQPESRFSAASGNKTFSDWTTTFGRLSRPRLAGRSLKKMASKLFTRVCPSPVVELNSCNGTTIPGPESACEKKEPGSSCSNAVRRYRENRQGFRSVECAAVKTHMVAREARMLGRPYNKDLLGTLALDPLAVTSDSIASEGHSSHYTASVYSHYQGPSEDLNEPGCDIPVVYVSPKESQPVLRNSQDPFCSREGDLPDYDEQRPHTHAVTHSRSEHHFPATPSEDPFLEIDSNNDISFHRSKCSSDTSSWYETLRVLCDNAEVESIYDQAELQEHRDWCCYYTNDESILQNQYLVPSRPAPSVPNSPVKIPSMQRKPSVSVWGRGHDASLQDHHFSSPSDSSSPSRETSSIVSPDTPLNSRNFAPHPFYSLESRPPPRQKASSLRQSPNSFDDVLDTVEEEAMELDPDTLRLRFRESSRVRRLVAKFEG